ncbi:TIGR02206 family membrane protein, partial [Salmonella enterica subsp. arizonae serovar 41:z4,z23:-]|nr:TIGR02206 family membrane protein [Salmonella enterica subsp. arizonae serovar 41:z4,z23:-]
MSQLSEKLYFSQNPFTLYTPIHFLMLILAGICIGIVIKKRDEIAMGKYAWLRWVFLGVYLIQQG